jgi:hypothetical protein
MPARRVANAGVLSACSRMGGMRRSAICLNVDGQQNVSWMGIDRARDTCQRARENERVCCTEQMGRLDTQVDSWGNRRQEKETEQTHRETERPRDRETETEEQRDTTRQGWRARLQQKILNSIRLVEGRKWTFRHGSLPNSDSCARTAKGNEK